MSEWEEVPINDEWTEVPLGGAAEQRPSLLGRAWKAAKDTVAGTAETAAKLPFAIAPILPEPAKRGLLHAVEGIEDYRKQNAAPPAQGFMENAADVVGATAPWLVAGGAGSLGRVGGGVNKAGQALSKGVKWAIPANAAFERMQQGVDTGESMPRSVAGAATSAATARAMLELPMATRKQAMASAVAMPALGISERTAQNAITDRPELQQDVFNPKAIATDVLMGLGFSGVSHWATVRNSNKIVDSVARKIESGEPVSELEIWAVRDIAKGGKGQAAAERAKGMSDGLGKKKAAAQDETFDPNPEIPGLDPYTSFDRSNPVIPGRGGEPTVADAEAYPRPMGTAEPVRPRPADPASEQASPGIDSGPDNPYGGGYAGEARSSIFLDPFMLQRVEGKLGKALDPNSMEREWESQQRDKELQEMDAKELADWLNGITPLDSRAQRGLDLYEAFNSEQPLSRELYDEIMRKVEDPDLADQVLQRDPANMDAYLEAMRNLDDPLLAQQMADGRTRGFDIVEDRPLEVTAPNFVMRPTPVEAELVPRTLPVSDRLQLGLTPSGIDNGATVERDLAATLNKGAKNEKGKRTAQRKGLSPESVQSAVPPEGSAQSNADAQGPDATRNANDGQGRNAHEGQKGLLKAVPEPSTEAAPATRRLPTAMDFLEIAAKAQEQEAQKEPTRLVTKPEREFHKKLMGDVSKGVQKVLEKVEAYPDWQWSVGDRVKSSQTGNVMEITGRTWDMKQDKPMYRYKTIGLKDGEESGTLYAKPGITPRGKPHPGAEETMQRLGDIAAVPPKAAKGKKAAQAEAAIPAGLDAASLEKYREILAAQGQAVPEPVTPTPPVQEAPAQEGTADVLAKILAVGKDKGKKAPAPDAPAQLPKDQVYTAEGAVPTPPAPVVERKAKRSTPAPIEEAVHELGVEVAPNEEQIYPNQRLRVKQLEDQYGGDIERAIQALGPIEVAKQLLVKPSHVNIFRVVEGVHQLEDVRLGGGTAEIAPRRSVQPPTEAITPAPIGEPTPEKKTPSGVIVRKGGGKPSERGSSPELAELVNAIAGTQTFKATRDAVHAFGERVYQAGMKFKEFTQALRAHAGELWKKVKAHVSSAWTAAKKAYRESPLGNERGSVTVSNPFYSKAEKVIEEKMGGRMKVKDFLNLLDKNGVTKDEVAQLDLVHEIPDSFGYVTKDQARDILAAHKTELKDVILGGKKDDLLEELDKKLIEHNAFVNGTTEGKKWEIYGVGIRDGGFYSDVTKIPEGPIRDAVMESLAARGITPQSGRRLKGENNTVSPTYYDSYVTPGGKDGSYREMFVTAPNLKESPSETRKYTPVEVAPLDNDTIRKGSGLWRLQDRATGELVGTPSMDKPSIPITWSDGHGNYDHIKNPVVRIRFNERLIDGEPDLDLSWAYGKELAAKYGEFTPHGETPHWYNKATPSERAKFDALADEKKRVLFIEEMQGPNAKEQEQMPKYLRDRIYDLGVKRILAYAKEHGYDGVSWTTGEMQTDRYDLSTQIDSLYYTRDDNGNIDYAMKTLDGAIVKGDDGVPPEALANHVGKEIAQKIMEGKGVPAWKDSAYETKLENLDLKVGGEGLKDLYDKRLPALFKKYGKEGVGTLADVRTPPTPTWGKRENWTYKEDSGTWEIRESPPELDAKGREIFEDRPFAIHNQTTGEQYFRPYSTLEEAKARVQKEIERQTEAVSLGEAPHVPITEKTPESYTLYDITSIPTLAFKEARDVVHRVGESLYQPGMKFKEFMGAMKEKLAEVWEHAKAHIETAWKAAKKAYKEIPVLGNEKGAVGLDINAAAAPAADPIQRVAKDRKAFFDSIPSKEEIRVKGAEVLEKPRKDWGRIAQSFFYPAKGASQDTKNALYKRKGDIDRVMNYATLKLKDVAKHLAKYDEKQQLAMIVNMRDGHIDQLVGKEREYFDIMDALGRSVWDKVVELDPEMEKYRKDNHALLTLQWIMDGEAEHKGGLWSPRNLEGTKTFLKRRSNLTVEEMLEMGKALKSTNIVEIGMHTLRNQLKYVETGFYLKEAIASGRAIYVPDGVKLREGYEWMPTSVADVHKKLLYPSSVRGKEYVDKGMYEGLLRVARRIGVNPERVVSAGARLKAKGVTGNVSGVMGFAASKSGETVVQHNTPMGVLAHEIGHQIDFKFNLWDRIVEDVQGTRKVSAAKMQKVILNELGAIANMTGREHDYSHSKPEMVAQMVEAYIQAPETMRTEAPHVYAAFEKYIQAVPELKGLSRLKQGIHYRKLTYDLDVPPPSFIKSFNVLDDAGKVVARYPQRGLAVEFAVKNGHMRENANGEMVPNIRVWMSKPVVEHAGKWAIPEAEARMLNNSLSEDKIRGNSYTNFLMEVKNRWTAVELFSGFHYFTIMQEVISSRAGMAFQQGARATYGALSGNAATKGEMEALGRTMNPLNYKASVVLGSLAKDYLVDPKGFERNPKVQQQLRDWFGDDAPKMGELVTAYFRAGGNLHQDRNLAWGKVKLKGHERIAEGYKKGNAKEMVLGGVKVPMDVANFLVKDLLFEKFVPNAKFADFALQYSYDLKQFEHELRRGDITKEQLAQRNLMSAENRFGEMNWENFWLDRSYKSALQLMFRSFSWQYGTWRGFGTAAARIPSQVAMLKRAIANHEIPPVDRDLAWVVTLLGTHVAEATMIGYIAAAATGRDELKPKEWMDYIFPKIGLLTRIAIPGYVKEPISLWKDAEDSPFYIPANYVISKLSGYFGKMAEVWKNKDYYGDKVFDEDAPFPERAQDILWHMTPKPFPYESYLREAQQGEANTGTNFMNAMGFNKAPGWISKSKALAMAQKYNAGNVAEQGRRKEDSEDRGTKRAVLGHLRKGGTLDTLPQETMSKLDKLGPDRALRLIEQAQLTEIQYAFKSLKYLPEAVNVWNKMDEKEKQETAMMMAEKVMAYNVKEMANPERIEQMAKKTDPIMKEIERLGNKAAVSSPEDAEVVNSAMKTPDEPEQDEQDQRAQELEGHLTHRRIWDED